MPDFTVIEGSGKSKEDKLAEWALESVQYEFSQLVTEILRAVARGDDHSSRVARALNQFLKKFAETDASLPKILHPVFTEAHENLDGYKDDYCLEIGSILKAALSLSAEKNASDGFAKGRASKREEVLRNSIENHFAEREKRSRQNGWSCTASLLQKHGLDPIFRPARPQRGKRRP
jgi:hypothetical protein